MDCEREAWLKKHILMVRFFYIYMIRLYLYQHDGRLRFG